MTQASSIADQDRGRVVRLDDRAAIRLQGPDWRSFLQGLITQDVETIQLGEVRYGALLTPQGRLLHDLFVWADETGARLDVDAAGREGLIARLAMYRLRAKVEIAPDDGSVWALTPGGGTASSEDGWRADPRLAALGWRALGRQPPPSAADAGDRSDYEAVRLGLGAPDLGRDGLSDKAYAVEANLDLLSGVDFRKGCFVGQETTSRMKRRGIVKTRLVPLSFAGEPPAPGAEVLAGDPSSGALRAGEVCSGGPGRALALIRLDRARGGELSVDGRPVRLDPPAWLQPALVAAEAVGA